MPTGNFLFQRVDWRAFDAFRGELDFDFNQLFNALVSGDPPQRSNTLFVFDAWPRDNLRDIGRLGAIPDVVACLAELIAIPEIPDRPAITNLIAGYADDLDAYCRYPWHGQTPFTFAMQVRTAFLATIPTLLNAIDDDDPLLRAAVVRVLGALGRPETGGALTDRLRMEQDPNVQAMILQSLRAMPASGIRALAEMHIESGSPDLRVHAAGVLALQERPFPNQWLPCLARVAISPEEPSFLSKALTTAQKRTRYQAHEIIRDLPRPARVYVVESWIDNLAFVPTDQLHEYFMQMILHEFRHDPPDLALAEHMLLANEARIIGAMAGCDAYWAADNAEWVAGREWMQRQYKLPATRAQLLQKAEFYRTG